MYPRNVHIFKMPIPLTMI